MRSNEIFNNFPSDWYSIPLGQLVKESNGIIQTGPFGSQLHAEDYVLIGTPSIMPKNISVNGVIDTDIARIKASDLERLSRYQVKKGDIIYSRRGDVEKCALISERENGWLCGTGCILIRLGNSDISPEFLHAYLSHPLVRAWIVRHAIGATMPNLNTTILSELPVLVPTKKIRKCIKENWTSLTKKILINSEINQTLEQMARALFKSWFVDFEPIKAKIATLEAGGSQEDATLAAMTAISGKDADALMAFEREHPEQYAELKSTAELFPSAMQTSELGEIPKGWSSQRFSNIATLHYGKALKKTERIEGPYPVYGSGGVTGSHNNYLIEGPSVIVGRKGSIGTLYWEDGKFHPIDTVYYVANKDEIPLSYLYYLMETLNLPSMNTDAAVPGLNRDNIYRLEVLKPIQSILNKFNSHISAIKNMVQKNNVSIATLMVLRDTLLPKLLSGEITLPETEQAIGEVENV
ncbi:restriction endonuclease subunit S [Serratia marcescens]|uniref:restriction endonuclease subunit S n=1 Tax=Serratia marcescens TaxID=615 RepID=UPI000CDDCFA2|nr:restriction endonuclease subunit S [Serratia marcescens]POX29238.1 restriction endonuclease subunit S [Serratia marcescens]